MTTKTLSIFYGIDNLPYKDSAREIHFPLVGNTFNGSNNVTNIRFYVDRIGGTENVTWLVVSKLPNGQIGNEVLNSNNAVYDEELGEHYIELSLSSYYTSLKGDVYLSLNGYQGGVEVEEDEDTGVYSIYGTPTIQATGVVKIGINYAPQTIAGSHFNTSDLQQVLGLISDKANISDVIVVLDNIASADLTGYSEGQLLFDKETNRVYIISSGSATLYDILDLTSRLALKQDTLTFDSTPTASSTNPVTSGGIKTYVDNADDTLKTYVKNNFVMHIPYSVASAFTHVKDLVVAITPALLSTQCKMVVELTQGEYYLCYYKIDGFLTTVEVAKVGSKDRWEGIFNSTELNNTSISSFLSTSSSNSYYQPYATENYVKNYHDATKQDKLIAGANITISDSNVISATGGGGGDFRYEVVEELPEEGEEGVIYLVPKTGGVSPDVYNEYLWIPDLWDYEFIGTTAVDLSNYVDLTSTQTISGTKNFHNITANQILGENSQGYVSFNSIRPIANNTYNLGTSGLNWKDIYLSGTAYVNTIESSAELYLGKNGYSIYAKGGLKPSSNNSFDLGSSSYAWKDLYLRGNAIFDYGSGNVWRIIRDSQYNLSIKMDNDIQYTFQNRAFFPRTMGLTNLGESSYKWKNIYFSGYLNDGNNANYGLALPDTASYTANQTIATTSDLPQVKRFI